MRSISAFLLLFLLHLGFLQAQEVTIYGKILDKENGQAVISASVYDSITGKGTLTDYKGFFTLKSSLRQGVLLISHVSYTTERFTYTSKDNNVNCGVIFIESQIINLDEVSVVSSFVTDRNIPIAFSTVNSRKIEQRLGNHDYPEILKFTPGIYATREGGGSGDSRLSLRGFQQENVSLLLNGVPVSSMENGLVYWSNWVGLADATEALQVQRGIGASRAAMNSVGGTINIITKPAEAAKGGFLKYSISNYGNQKTVLSLSSGKMKNNTAFTFLGSRTVGPGFVDATYVDGWSYFFSFAYQPASRHKFLFTALGSPEKHGQRNYPMSIQDYEKYGIKFNNNWGVYKGEILNLSENFYHKPQISLNYYFTASPKLKIMSSAYFSLGYGGGRYTEAFNYGASTWSFRKNDLLDFDAIFANNRLHSDSALLADGTFVKGYSKNILTHFRANHYWAGLLNNVTLELSPKVNLIAGLHARTFRSHLYEEINDLLGGNFWVDNYAWSPSGISGRKQIKKVGDIINVNNYSSIVYGSVFSQLEYNYNALNVFLGTTFSATSFRRKDPQNYVSNPHSEIVNRAGFDLKAGASYKIGVNGKYGHVYSNFGYFSKEPYYKFIYVTYSNSVAKNIKNEKIMGAELGYIFDNHFINTRLNFYSTLWRDKAVQTYENIQVNDSTFAKSNMKGLSALHSGIELEVRALLSSSISMAGVASFGNWKWNSNAVAQFTNDNEVLVAETPIYSKGLYVGDAPQTQLGLNFDYQSKEGLLFSIDWAYYDRLYANFDPVNRTDEADKTQPFELPSYTMIDAMLGYNFYARQFPVTLQLNCQNLLNKEVITRGNDGSQHDLASFKGFWSLGRTFNFSAKVSF